MKNRDRARAILWGLGALGSKVVDAFAAGVDDLEIAGAVDHDPRLANRSLRDAFSSAALPDLIIQPSLESCIAGLERPADVLFHMTESHVPTIRPQLDAAMNAGMNVISASEGMFHPKLRFPAEARALHDCALRNGVSVVGCGINPGFVFDSLVLVLGRVSTAVTSVSASRVVDVTGTGPHDIDHVGFGLPTGEFEDKLKTGRIVGHMSMPESIASLGERFGLEIERIDEDWKAHTYPEAIESGSDLGPIEPGCVVGITQTGAGYARGRAAIRLTLEMFYGPDRFGHRQIDEIFIEGTHRIHASLTPAAVSIKGAGLMIINAAHDVISAAPGLCSVLDFSMGGRRRGGFELILDPDNAPAHNKTWLAPRYLE
ncbi:MAG: hypothetical protein OXC26_26135 [Albidovulum sp.]|nr:hypothetical protein [Albidovulum sp.]